MLKFNNIPRMDDIWGTMDGMVYVALKQSLNVLNKVKLFKTKFKQNRMPYT